MPTAEKPEDAGAARASGGHIREESITGWMVPLVRTRDRQGGPAQRCEGWHREKGLYAAHGDQEKGMRGPAPSLLAIGSFAIVQESAGAQPELVRPGDRVGYLTL
jgi:hypothetical protein